MFPLADNLPRRSYPYVNRGLIWLNVAVFVFELGVGDRLDLVVWWLGLVPVRWQEGHPWILLTLVSSLFLHAGWAHLIGNLWFLHIFGEALEDRLGKVRFLVFYLSCGILAGLLHVLTRPDSDIPALGASGAISGVLAAYWRLFPKARVATLFVLFLFVQVLQIPAFLWIGLWFVEQLLAGMFSLASVEVGVAYWAHVGGFLVGLLILPLFRVEKRVVRAQPS